MVKWDNDLGGDVFDILTQGLFASEGDLPDVDKHLQSGLTSTLNSSISISMTKRQRNYTGQLQRKYRDSALTSPCRRFLQLLEHELLPTNQEKLKLQPPSISSTTFPIEKEDRPPSITSINLSVITINIVSKDCYTGHHHENTYDCV